MEKCFSRAGGFFFFLTSPCLASFRRLNNMADMTDSIICSRSFSIMYYCVSGHLQFLTFIVA